MIVNIESTVLLYNFSLDVDPYFLSYITVSTIIFVTVQGESKLSVPLHKLGFPLNCHNFDKNN